MSSSLLVRNLSKKYHVYPRPVDRFRQMLWGERRRFYSEIWALRNVSFEVEKGTTFGIIGRNGSGKSTVLQVISGTLTPTEGEVHLSGRCAALLELGAGFDPQFTGRENLLLNCAAMGISQRQVESGMQEIVDFSGIGDFFFDQPVKIYSSGMLMRLAFSATLFLDPEVLVIDEVLSVGDVAFQQKCVRRLREFQKNGKTIILASHDMNAVRNLCHRALVLEQGKVVFEGDPEKAVNRYFSLLHLEAEQRRAEFDRYGSEFHSVREFLPPSNLSFQISHQLERLERHGTGEARIVAVELAGENNRSGPAFEFGEQISIAISIEFKAPVRNAILGFMIQDRFGQDILGFNSQDRGQHLGDRRPGDRMVACFTTRLYLRPDTYTLRASLRYALETGIDIDVIPQCHLLQVLGPKFPVWGIAYSPTRFETFLCSS